MKVFVDTSAWLAIEIKNDVNHKKATEYKTSLQKQRALLFTNDYILAETYTRLIYDKHLKAALNFRDKILKGVKSSALVILNVDISNTDAAWKELKHFSDHKLSFADATIIVHFKKYRLDHIFTFDSHFRDINLPTNLS